METLTHRFEIDPKTGDPWEPLPRKGGTPYKKEKVVFTQLEDYKDNPAARAAMEDKALAAYHKTGNQQDYFNEFKK